MLLWPRSLICCRRRWRLKCNDYILFWRNGSMRPHIGFTNVLQSSHLGARRPRRHIGGHISWGESGIGNVVNVHMGLVSQFSSVQFRNEKCDCEWAPGKSSGGNKLLLLFTGKSKIEESQRNFSHLTMQHCAFLSRFHFYSLHHHPPLNMVQINHRKWDVFDWRRGQRLVSLICFD